jgi:hypothetical protein
MAVLWNGLAQLEFDRDKPLPDYQGAYLDKMDAKMAAGIEIDGQRIVRPDMGQRAQFVTANLVHALKNGDEAQAAAMCSYLAMRLPDLRQVKIADQEGEVNIELVFDQDYIKQHPVTFTKLN